MNLDLTAEEREHEERVSFQMLTSFAATRARRQEKSVSDEVYSLSANERRRVLLHTQLASRPVKQSLSGMWGGNPRDRATVIQEQKRSA